MNALTIEELYEMYCRFHVLWTKSVGQEGYDKQDWARLSWLLERILEASLPCNETGWILRLEGLLGHEKMEEISRRVHPGEGR